MKHEQAQALSKPAQSPVGNFGGHWVNELTSTMDLVLKGDQISGTYASQVSGGGAPIKGDITGSVAGHLISFSVNWQNGSITNWIGHLVTESGQEWIETLWQLGMSTKNPSDATELWESVFAGSDRFHR